MLSVHQSEVLEFSGAILLLYIILYLPVIVSIIKSQLHNLYILCKLYSKLVVCSSFEQPVQEPEKMTKIIVQALDITGQRGIINRGWGGLGLGNCES